VTFVDFALNILGRRLDNQVVSAKADKSKSSKEDQNVERGEEFSLLLLFEGGSVNFA